MDLPKGTNQKLWRRTFVSTYMQFAATQSDPWNIPANVACEKLQIIWDSIFPDIEYTVTSTGAVYLLVCHSWSRFLSLTVLSDRFCNDLLTHGVAPSVPLLFPFSSHTSNHKTTYGIPTKVVPNLRRLPWTNFGLSTKRPTATTKK